MVLFVVLLRRFIYMEAIQTNNTDLISRIYQIMIINMLNNRSFRYSNYYFIKFICFIPIYYAINLNIVSSYMIFSYLYIQYIANLNQ